MGKPTDRDPSARPRHRPRPVVALVAGLTVLVASACSTSNPSGSGTAAGTTAGTVPASGAGSGTTPRATGDGSGAWLDTKATRQVAGTDGRQYIADAQGRALQLRGFNIKTRDPLKDASDDLLAAGQARGFHLLRLSIYWDQFEPEKDRYDQQYLDAVKTVLDRAQAHGIVVILDFHQDVFGAAFGDHGVPVWATRTDDAPFVQQSVWFANYLQPAVQNAWEHLYEDPDIRQAQIDAWVTVATRFQDHPAVLGYDLLNEPFGKLGSGEDLATAANRVQAEQLTPMYQRLADAVHGVDPDRWIFIEAPNVASLGLPVGLKKVNGTKIAYFPHMYDSSIEAATYVPGGQVQGFDPTFFDKYEKAIVDYPMQNGYPTFFGEWGLAHPDRPGMDEFVARSLALMDRVGSGWTVFNWCKGESYCPIDKEGRDRVAIGQIVQPYASAIAGSPTSFRWDPKAKTLQVVFTDAAGMPAGATTDLVVPPSTYPDGFSVQTGDGSAGSASAIDGAYVVHVTTPRTGGAHAICLGPKGASPACSP